MKARKPIQSSKRFIQRSGTTLLLGAEGRSVRVLTVPHHCGQRILHHNWDEAFGAEDGNDIVVWWPWDPANSSGPSRN